MTVVDTVMLTIARDLAARGFSVIPLDHPEDTWVTDPDGIGKTAAVPWSVFQQTRPTDEQLRDWFGNGRQRNLAIVTGSISGIVAVDGDSREALAWMDAYLPHTPGRIKTARGEHRLYRHPGVLIKNKVRIRTGDSAVKIDVRGDGGYIVAQGSQHRTGILYEPIGEWSSVDALPMFDPRWLETIAPPERSAPLPEIVSAGARNSILFREAAKLRYAGLEAPEIRAALDIMNAQRCRPPLPAHEIATIVASAAKYARGQTEFATYTTPARRAGEIIAEHQGNVRLAMARLGLSFSHNAFAAKDLATYDGVTHLLDDVIVQRAWLQIDEIYRFRPSLYFLEIVIKDLARRCSFHPVRDYLDRLVWDREPRIDRWLARYGGAEDTAPDRCEDQSYLEAVSSIVLIAAVRRVRSPGCKFDESLVLEAPQGKFKSQAVRALCPNDEWFSDDLPLGVSAKEIIERTAGKWIIEASELHGYSNAQIDHLKSTQSRQTDGPVRLAYGRFSVEVPRQFIIVATTNKLTEYLRDSTGGRRFWPVRIQEFDVDALRRDRDQLWAEAAAREAAGESIRLPEALWSAAEIQQEARRLVDPWEELLEDHQSVSLAADALLVETLWSAPVAAGTH